MTPIKDNKYWSLHKDMWQDEFDSLEADVARKVMNDPYSDEAINFERRINRLVDEEMKKSN
jgi:hypothetical protein|tara:strand:+ start:353 stop:535 length:183 start_codon:yes stop_codon:yes gene_type:complete